MTDFMGVQADGEWKRNWNERQWVVCQHVDFTLFCDFTNLGAGPPPKKNKSKQSSNPHPYTWSKNPYS